jgi:hypothetical protein
MEQVQFLHWILDVCVNKEGVCFAVNVFDCNLEAVEALCFGCHYFGGNLLLRFSLMMPSEAAKNTRTWEMMWHSVLDSLSMRSISSVVQKEASTFFYIRHMSSWCMGKSTK